jgi:hypothetical protein
LREKSGGLREQGEKEDISGRAKRTRRKGAFSYWLLVLLRLFFALSEQKRDVSCKGPKKASREKAFCYLFFPACPVRYIFTLNLLFFLFY